MITDLINRIGDKLPKYELKNNISKKIQKVLFHKKKGETGAGIGSAQKNILVEAAAILHVKKGFEEKGWIVTTVESDKCGYDLLCVNGRNQKHVEVKGISGKKKSFIITSNEVHQSQIDDNFELCLVTSAMINPQTHSFTGMQFNELFSLKALSYFAKLKKLPKN